MKKIIVLFLFTLFLMGCHKVETPFTFWENKMDQNVVIVCNRTFFTLLPMTKYRRDELNTSRPMLGYEYKVYNQTDYLKEHPIQTGITYDYNIIDYQN